MVQNIIKEKKLFTSLDAYISGSIDNGLFIFSGKLMQGVSYEKAEKALNEEIHKIINNKVKEKELQKVKNKVESRIIFSETEALSKAMNLSFHELIGNAEDINFEIEKYTEVSLSDIQNQAEEIFRPENCSTLYYKSK